MWTRLLLRLRPPFLNVKSTILQFFLNDRPSEYAVELKTLHNTAIPGATIRLVSIKTQKGRLLLSVRQVSSKLAVGLSPWPIRQRTDSVAVRCLGILPDSQRHAVELPGSDIAGPNECYKFEMELQFVSQGSLRTPLDVGWTCEPRYKPAWHSFIQLI